MATREERSRSFGAVAVDYDRARTGPPAEAIAWLLPAGARAAVDLGAGTGKLSRVLADQVPQVTAVEPDGRMRAVLRAHSPGVQVVEGTGEAIPLPDASVDGVFVSSAWHWMDPALAVPEIARVLRDGGRFGVLGTGMDRESGWLREIRWRPDGQSRSDESTDRDASSETQARHRDHQVTLPAGDLFGNIQTRRFGFSRTMTIDGIVDMLGTYSRLITATPEDRAAVLDAARTALTEHFPTGGEIDVPMRTWCWRANRTPRDLN
jgi:SAM-dependent methyltransferase